MTEEEIVGCARDAMDVALVTFWDEFSASVCDVIYKELDLNSISINIGDKSYALQLGQMIRIQTV